MSMKSFYTKADGNRLEQLNLMNADGSESEYYLLIKGSHSDSFRTAKMQATRMVAVAEGSKEKLTDIKRAELLVHCETFCVASLIGGWNFEEEYTPELALEFLENAPDLERQINLLAVRTSGVDSKKSKPSTNGQEKKSNSQKRQKVKKHR